MSVIEFISSLDGSYSYFISIRYLGCAFDHEILLKVVSGHVFYKKRDHDVFLEYINSIKFDYSLSDSYKIDIFITI